MNYDDWKTETPEDEQYRINARTRKHEREEDRPEDRGRDEWKHEAAEQQRIK